MLNFYLRKESDRNKTYGVLLESIPTLAIIAVFIGFIVLVAAFVIGGVLGPQPYIWEKKDYHHAETHDFWHGTGPIEYTFGGLNGLNQEFYVSMSWYSLLANETGIFKNNVKFSIQLFGRNSPSDPYTPLSHDDGNSTHAELRGFECPQLDADVAMCNPIIMVHRSFIDFNEYKVQISLLDSFDLHRLQFISDDISLILTATNGDYSSMAIGWRYTFVALTTLVFIAYAIIISKKQRWTFWHTEQKWVLLLFVFLLAYDNPVYACIFFIPSWLFPFLNVLFMVSFICFLLLALLTITHAVLKKPAERTIVWFYLPKFMVVLPLWAILVAVITFINVSEKESTHVGMDAVPYATPMQAVGVALVVLYVLMLFYYIARVLGKIRNLPIKYSSRFKIVWSFTALVIIGSVVNTVLVMYLAINNAGLFLSYHALYNLYAYVLAFLFLPSTKVEQIDDVDTAPEEDQMHIETEEVNL